jgi:hypothetical protein
MKRGNQEPFKLLNPDPSYVPQMPQKMGRYSLNEILIALSIARSELIADTLLTDLIAEPSLRERLIRAFFKLRNAAFAHEQTNIHRPSQLFVAINCLRVNQPFESLYRTKLFPAIDELVEQKGDVTAFLASRINGAKMFLSEIKNNKIVLDGWLGKSSNLCVRGDLTVNGQKISENSAIHLLDHCFPLAQRGLIASICKKAS